MKDQRLTDVLEGKEDNYLLPFYWQHGDHYERIPEQIQRIADSGCRALCVESRPHPDFCGEGWWRDMDRILAECEKRDMRVWILDDKEFPTGYANGLLTAQYPEHRQWEIREHHVDVMGPMKDASLIIDSGNTEEELLGVYAYRRSGTDEDLTGAPIDLTAGVREAFLYWDIPDGCYRVFFFYKTRRGGHAHYIDMISEESVAVQIEAVYEPHYAHYARYFGNTLAGFFSDEPAFGNGIIGQTRVNRGIYEQRIGMEGQALPYNEKLLAMMSDELGEAALPYFGELWYRSEHAHLVRLAYMNAATRLYRDCFCRQIGNWCRAHEVEYIGHVIEDMNAHTRLGYGTGHYFRALDGQDMSGIDIVLHQVLPGFAHYMHTSIASGGMVDPEFFHYVLAKLGASLAHQSPQMKGRAMCEIFGAYGWGEGAPMMRWLMDFLLVRGINWFVPHAFSPAYPDQDCPPHFGGEGHDPQFDGFSALMRYTNRMSHLLSGGRHIASAAILYHAEGEWMSCQSMLTQKPAKVLYDAHIDFDIVPADLLMTDAKIADGQLWIQNETFGALVVPYAQHLPEKLVRQMEVFAAEAGDLPYRVVPLEGLASVMRNEGIYDLTVEGNFPLLRTYHCQREENHLFFFFNESSSLTANTLVRLPVRGNFVRLRLLEEVIVQDSASEGRAALHLLPGQSELWIFCDTEGLAPVAQWTNLRELAPDFTLKLAESDDLTDWRSYMIENRLFNITSPDRLPYFSGKMQYTFSLMLDRLPDRIALDLGRVGQTARLTVNGKDCGIRIAPPYRFELTGILQSGDNCIEIEVANTLVQKQRDGFSRFLQLTPSGLLGPLMLLQASMKGTDDEPQKTDF